MNKPFRSRGTGHRFTARGDRHLGELAACAMTGANACPAVRAPTVDLPDLAILGGLRPGSGRRCSRAAGRRGRAHGDGAADGEM